LRGALLVVFSVSAVLAGHKKLHAEVVGWTGCQVASGSRLRLLRGGAALGAQPAKRLGGLGDSFLHGPEAGGLEVLDKKTALEAMRKHEREGLCHSVWTFQTPFIAGICNCDRADCMAMRATLNHDFPVMFRSEYVAAVLPDPCNGCRLCMKLCQFGAMGYSAATRKAWIDPRRCYGCGICRSVCKPGAIELRERTSVPLAANRW